MQRDLEQILAYHCGPTLLGMKAGSLVSCSQAEFPGLQERAEYYNRAFKRIGIRFRILCTCESTSLLLVYRPALLRGQLSDPLSASLLYRAGYPEEDLDAQLAHLSTRLKARCGSFPHEIGLFLGYPPEDVLGFQVHQGRNCKLCGHWKVYSNEEQARALFQRYDRCRDVLCRRVAQGFSITRLFPAAS